MNDIPKLGWIAHVRTTTAFGWAIRKCLDKWNRAYCNTSGQVYVPVWGNHDGIVVPCEGAQYGVGIGEAEPFRGSIITPWEDYLKKIKKGKRQVRLLSVIGESEATHGKAATRWVEEVKGKRYDWLAIWKFFTKIMLGDLSENVKDWEFAIWCTEGVGIAWTFSRTAFQICRYLVFPLQNTHPTPMTVEQCAGWVARKPRYKTTLRLEASLGESK